jgi:hypothetical protein
VVVARATIDIDHARPEDQVVAFAAEDRGVPVADDDRVVATPSVVEAPAVVLALIVADLVITAAADQRVIAQSPQDGGGLVA